MVKVPVKLQIRLRLQIGPELGAHSLQNIEALEFPWEYVGVFLAVLAPHAHLSNTEARVLVLRKMTLQSSLVRLHGFSSAPTSSSVAVSGGRTPAAASIVCTTLMDYSQCVSHSP